MAQYLIAAAISLAISTALRVLFPTNVNQAGNRLQDLDAVGSAYGAGIPKVYGRMRLPGNVIWAKKLREQAHTEVMDAGKGATVTATTYSYYATFAVLLSVGDVNLRPLRIWGDKKLLWQHSGGDPELAGELDGGGDFEFMPGGPSQARSAIMEAELGTAETPAYRYRSVMVFSELPVVQFGNRMPLIEVEVANGTSTQPASISEILLNMCLEVGLDQADVDVTEVTVEAHGLQIGQGSSAQTIEMLVSGFNLQTVCSGATLAFRTIDQPVAVEVTEDDLLAQTSGRFPIKRLREDELPRSLTVKFLDPERDYQAGAQRVQRQQTKSKMETVVDLPIAISVTQAAQGVDSILYRAWTARTRYGPFGLPQRYLFLEPGDVVGITVDGTRHEVRILSIAIGANNALELEGEAYDSLVLTGVYGGGGGYFPPQLLSDYGDTYIQLLDVPALTDAEAQQVGYRVAATGTGASWRGGSLEVSVDGGTSWVFAYQLLAYTVGGEGAGTLAPPPANIGAANIDPVSTISVTLIKGSLSSVTDEMLIAGANRAMLGDEMIQFGVATLTSPLTYTLSHLLRGRRGTEAEMSGHAANEPFVLLGTAPFVPAQASSIGVPFQYRITPSPRGQTSSPYSFTLTGISARPFAPVDIRGALDGSNNLTITWIRRSRLGTELPNAGSIPLDEASQSYEIDIMDGVDVVRTLTATAPSVVYSAALQATDFGSPEPTTVDVRVYQIGNLYGRSPPGTATLNL